MPQKKKAQQPPKKSLSKKKTAIRKKNHDSVDVIAGAMMHNLNRIKESDGLKKAKKMLFNIVGGVQKAVQQFVEEHPLTPEQQRVLYKEMKMIAEGTGLHGVDVDFEDNILGGIF